VERASTSAFGPRTGQDGAGSLEQCSWRNESRGLAPHINKQGGTTCEARPAKTAFRHDALSQRIMLPLTYRCKLYVPRHCFASAVIALSSSFFLQESRARIAMRAARPMWGAGWRFAIGYGASAWSTLRPTAQARCALKPCSRGRRGATLCKRLARDSFTAPICFEIFWSTGRPRSFLLWRLARLVAGSDVCCACNRVDRARNSRSDPAHEAAQRTYACSCTRRRGDSAPNCLLCCRCRVPQCAI